MGQPKGLYLAMASVFYLRTGEHLAFVVCVRIKQTTAVLAQWLFFWLGFSRCVLAGPWPASLHFERAGPTKQEAPC